MAPKTRALLLAFAAFGLGAATWSSYVHYALLTRPGYTSFCDINDTFSCTQAYLSQYGSFWGVPVALGGVLYFAFVLLLVGFGGRRQAQVRENIPAYIFAVSTVALAFVLYLAWASLFRLQAVCMLCVATYAAVIGIFIVSGGATKFPMASLPGRAAQDIAALVRSPAALVLALVFTVGAVSLISAFPKEAQSSTSSAPAQAARQFPPLTDQQRSDFLRWLDVQPKEDVPVDPQGAKVVIVKFNDFQCPGCRDVYFLYRDMLEKYSAAGTVKAVTKHYPLEPECNPSVPGGNHYVACEAAAAMVMAESTGKAAEIEQWLFTNQSKLTPDSVKQAASDIGGIPDFDARYAQALTRVRDDASLGSRLKVKSTPTFFINGRRIEGGLPPPALQAAIEHEMKR